MRIALQGKSVDLPESVKTVSALLAWKKWDPSTCVVLRNHEVVDLEQNVSLSDGDTLDMVMFVGGG